MPAKIVSIAHAALPIPVTLAQVWQNWEQLPHANTELCQEWLRKVLLPRWLALCAHAVQHADVQSLIFWSAPDQRAEPMLQMLGEFYASRMQQAAAIAQSVLQASESVLSTPAARELVHFFRTGRWREAQCKVSLSVALAIDETHAAPMTLHLEQVDEDAPYPHPATMWFVSEDAAFRESVAQANVPPCRWHLEPLPPEVQLRGDSLGGAFAIAAQLLRKSPGDYRTVGVLARYMPSTAHLLPVEQFTAKYEALRRQRRLRLIISSPAQPELPLPRSQPCPTLDDAIRAILQLRRRQRLRRWSVALALLPVLALTVGLQIGSYRFYVMPSGRLMFQTGILPRRHIDTGYLLSELLPDRFQPGWQLRWSVQPSEQSDAPYRQIAPALVDPFKKARLYLLLNERALARQALPAANTPILPHRYRRLEILALLEPDQRPALVHHALQLPAPPNDYETALTRLLTLHRLGALPTDELTRRLKPLALNAPDDAIRLQALIPIAAHDPDWVLQNRALRTLLMHAAVDPTKRAYALTVLAHLSRTHPQQALPLFEPYRPLVQTEHERVEMLIQAIMTRDERLFRQMCASTEDLFLPSPADALPLRIVISHLLTEFARRRPTLQTRWDYLLRELQSPLSDRWSLYRDALHDAVLAITPPDERPRLNAYLTQTLEPPSPIHLQLWQRHIIQYPHDSVPLP
jgi:hypothetical protein